MKKNPRTVGAYSNPGTPEYGGGGEVPKSWSSERESNPSIRRHVSGAAAIMPFNSGRALPSKWDDAERWITSPVSSHVSATAIPRRPKSKSGPLGLIYLSPQNGSFMPHSSLTTGVLLPDGFSIRYDDGDEKLDGAAKEEAPISDGVEQRDMATQMSPDGITCSSSSLHQNGVPDVQVPKMKDLSHILNIPLPEKDSKDTSKLQREEAKITAWENLQKAKAEAAVRKLEMKLEKKRSASMDRIMKKLRASEMKARAMRNLLSENDPTQVRISSRGNCFLCHRN